MNGVSVGSVSLSRALGQAGVERLFLNRITVVFHAATYYLYMVTTHSSFPEIMLLVCGIRTWDLSIPRYMLFRLCYRRSILRELNNNKFDKITIKNNLLTQFSLLVLLFPLLCSPPPPLLSQVAIYMLFLLTNCKE